MKLAANLISTKIGDLFYSYLSALTNTDKILVAYDGVINGKTIDKLEKEIEKKFEEINLINSIRKKVFLVSIEILQNQFHHGAKDDVGCQHNFFILFLENNSKIKIRCANLILNIELDNLKKKLDFLNSIVDFEILKKYYLKKLEENELTQKGGAGLGFLITRKKMNSAIDYEIITINDNYSLFTFETSINTQNLNKCETINLN